MDEKRAPNSNCAFTIDFFKKLLFSGVFFSPFSLSFESLSDVTAVEEGKGSTQR